LELSEAAHYEADPVYREKLWMLGDEIEVRKFMNCITELLFYKYVKERDSLAVVDYIYENTSPCSALR
jgi:hypothetical protein